MWGSGKEQHELTENEKKFDKLWQRLRSRILYNGNNQIRNLESEFDKETNFAMINLQTEMEVLRSKIEQTIIDSKRQNQIINPKN